LEMDFAIWKNLVDNISDAIFILARNGDILFFNNAVVQLFGYSTKEMLAMNTYTLFHTGKTDVHLLEQVINTKSTVTSCQKYVRKDGGETPYMLVTHSPVFDEVGEVKYSVGIIRNIENLYRTYQNAVRMSPGTTIVEKSRVSKNFVYASEKMQRLIHKVEQVADSDAAILILGESGVGKEVLAEHIHRSSSRKDKKMVAINCAALPENLLEAELFGYEKGAFTGAQSTGKCGLIEFADGGTVFLDEIDSLSMAMQGKLLRVVETKQVRRLGGITARTVDFRLLATSNVDLKRAIEDKTFRMDLYYRLSVIPFTIPPLRERPEDIKALCQHFLEWYYIKYGRKKTFSEGLYAKLKKYHWPGNVRELKNFVERIVLMTDVMVDEISDVSDEMLENTMGSQGRTVPFASHAHPFFAENVAPYDENLTLKDNITAIERRIIAQSIEKYGSLAKAAKALGSSKSTLGRKVQRDKLQ